MLTHLTRGTISLNAITPPPEDDAARTQRHLRMCAQLSDIAVRLACALGMKAIANVEQAESPAEPDPAFEPAPEPEAQPAPEANPLAKSATARRAPALYARIRTCGPIDPGVLFNRVAATARACIVLEARLAAGILAPASASAPTTRPAEPAAAAALRADPRRTQLRDAISYLTVNNPYRTELLREATHRIDADLAADPEQILNLTALLDRLCKSLDVVLDYSKIPDPILDILAYEEDLESNQDPPDPHATPPP